MPRVYERARASAGSSSSPILMAIEKAVIDHHIKGGTILDLGAGRGQLWPHEKYIGVDVVKYDDFPDSLEFISGNLDEGLSCIPDETADLVVAVETIEHIKNPRRLFREMVRLVRSGK